MLPLLKIAVAAVVLLAIGAAIKLAARGKSFQTKYRYAQRNGLTENEQAMYWKLVAATPNHVVLAQVNMASIINGLDRPSHGTISQSSFDFVIFTRDFKPVAAIEIDDKTHERLDRKKADQTKNKACEAAGLKIIRWKSHKHPTTAEIHQALNLNMPPVTGVLRESMS